MSDTRNSLPAETGEPAPAKSVPFPLGTEGPFYRLQVMLRLLDEELLHNRRRVAVALAVTWLPMAILWLAQGQPGADDPDATLTSSLFSHIVTYARFFVTMTLLIVAETTVRPKIEEMFEQALNTGVILPARREQFFGLLVRSLEWRKSRVAEAVILMLAFAVAHVSTSILLSGHHKSWVHIGDTFTWAGRWYAYVALPFLQFLIFRWLFRLLIWWRTMYDMARIGLNILPAHPDGRGGLAFIGDSVQAFAILAFAFSAAAAGAVADFLLNEGSSVLELKGFILGASLFVLLLFTLPLLFFVPTLLRAKDEALLRYEGLASAHWQAFEQKHAGRRPTPPPPERIADPDFSALSDLGALIKGVREMRIVPLTREGLVPLLAAIVLPFLPILVRAVPLQELLKGVVHVFMGGEG